MACELRTLLKGLCSAGMTWPGRSWEVTVVRQNRSWFALVSFCAATALVAALGLAILIASATVAFALAQSFNIHRNGEATPHCDIRRHDHRCPLRSAARQGFEQKSRRMLAHVRAKGRAVPVSGRRTAIHAEREFPGDREVGGPEGESIRQARRANDSSKLGKAAVAYSAGRSAMAACVFFSSPLGTGTGTTGTA
jgi:hypothetical protein